MKDRMKGVVLDRKAGTLRHGREGGSVAGAIARVETAGEVERRFTATRLALIGPFALAFRKKKDRRELYLTVEGPGYAFVVELDPKDGAEARGFAAKINSASSKAALTAQRQAAAAVQAAAVTPPAPPPPPVQAPPVQVWTPPPTPAYQAPPVVAVTPTPPPGWYPDPTGRAGRRWWDGAAWTDHVAP